MDAMMAFLTGVWAFLNSPVGMVIAVVAVGAVLGWVKRARPDWARYEGTLIEAVKWAEKRIPDDTLHAGSRRFDEALKYFLAVYAEANAGKAPSKALIAAVEQGISTVHAELEANGNLDKGPAAQAPAEDPALTPRDSRGANGGGNVLSVLLVGLIALAVACGGCQLSGGQQYVIASESYTAAVRTITSLSKAGVIPLADIERVKVVSDRLDTALDEMRDAVVAGSPVAADWYYRQAQKLLDELIVLQMRAQARTAPKTTPAPTTLRPDSGPEAKAVSDGPLPVCPDGAGGGPGGCPGDRVDHPDGPGDRTADRPGRDTGGDGPPQGGQGRVRRGGRAETGGGDVVSVAEQRELIRLLVETEVEPACR